MMCCPLSEADETATVYDATTRRARRVHSCDECRAPVVVGERHRFISMLFDGAWSSHRLCLLCDEIGNHFACGSGRILGQLWEELEENFFPDMRMGGPCMEGLSPAAKLKLVTARMDWYLAQDEIDDSAWEAWPQHRDRQRPLPLPRPETDPKVPYYETPEYYWRRELELDAYRREGGPA